MNSRHKYTSRYSNLKNKLLTAIIWGIITVGSSYGNDIFRPGALLRSAREDLDAGRFESARIKTDSVSRHASSPLTRIEAFLMLAEIHRDLGEFDIVRQSYDKASELFTTSDILSSFYDPTTPDGINYSNMMLNRAQFELAAGRYDECERSLSKAHFVKGSEGEIRRLGCYASLVFRTGDSDRALNILDSAIAQSQNSPTRAVLHQNRGFILSEEGRLAEAVADFNKAIELTPSGKEHAIAMSNFALAQSIMGENEKAIVSIDDALVEIEKIEGRESRDYLIALSKKGEIQLRSARPRDAVKSMRTFFSGERKRLASILGQLSPQMRLDYWVQEKPILSKVFAVGEHDPSLMMDVALMRRETSLAGIKGRKDNGIMATGEDIRGLLNENEAAVAFVLHPSLDGRQIYSAVILTYNGELRFVSLFDESFVKQKMTVGDLSIEEAVKIEDPEAKNRLYSDSLLGEKIWRPIIECLSSNITTLHFAPEGIFHLWGIEHMPFVNNGDYNLIRHFSLLDIATPERLQKDETIFAGGLDYDSVPSNKFDSMREVSNHSAYSELRRSLGLREGEMVFGYLPGTAREVEEIAVQVYGIQPETELSEDDFKRKAPGKHLLHVATHGYALDCGIGMARYLPTDTLAFDVSLLRSGIALSGANVLGTDNFKEDGILSAREICDLDLSEVDMVVLSACQTARGYITDESASGLIRALKIAGVRTIVATLWEVDDNATTLFMTAFHRLVKEGVPRDEAFRAAKEFVATFAVKTPIRQFSPSSLSGRIIGYEEKFPYEVPWYWAPFIMIDP